MRQLFKLAFAVCITAAVLAPASADIFVSGNHSSILQFDDSGVFIQQFNIGGSINNGRGVIFGPDGNMYVCSLSSNDVQRFDGTTGAFIDVFTNITSPWDLVFRANGNLLVSDFQGDVHEFDSAGAPLGVFAAGAGAAGLTFGPDGNLYVGSFSQDSVRRYDGANGAFIDVFVSAGSGGLNGSDGVTFGPDGNLYVSSRSTNQVLRYNGATGAFIDVFTSGAAPNPPVDLQFGPDGNLAVVSAISSEDVKRYNGATGVFIDTYAAGSGIDTPTHFTFTPDSDGDGVLDPDDICPDTSIPEGVPTVNLNSNHWALVDDDFDFDTVSSGEGQGPGRGYTTTDTAGCSCEQIIEALGLGLGHIKFGCSISAMDEWVELVNP